jgi:hypothetical protein
MSGDKYRTLPAEQQSITLAEKVVTLTNNSKEALEKRAEASFRKEERAKDGKKGTAEYEAEGRAIREKTARLRALRLAKEAAEKNEEVATKPVKPASQKRTIRSTS